MGVFTDFVGVSVERFFPITPLLLLILMAIDSSIVFSSRRGASHQRSEQGSRRLMGIPLHRTFLPLQSLQSCGHFAYFIDHFAKI